MSGWVGDTDPVEFEEDARGSLVIAVVGSLGALACLLHGVKPARLIILGFLHIAVDQLRVVRHVVTCTHQHKTRKALLYEWCPLSHTYTHVSASDHCCTCKQKKYVMRSRS